MKASARCTMALALTAWALLAMAGGARAGQRTITVTGRAAVLGEDVAGALRRARAEALRLAIERVMGVRIISRVVLHNDLLNRSQLYAFSKGAIRTYRVLSEDRESNPVSVTLVVTVLDKVRHPGESDPGLLSAAMDYPRLLLLMTYRDQEPEPGLTAAQSALVQTFVDRGFQVIDPPAARRLARQLISTMDPAMQARRAARLAQRFFADVVIISRPTLISRSFGGVSEHAQVGLESRAVVATTAQVLARLRLERAAAHISSERAVSAAAALAGREQADRLMARILNWWSSYIAGGVPYLVQFRHPPGREALVIRFTEALEKLPGVAHVRELASGGGLLKLAIRYKGARRHLRRDLYRALKGRRGFGKLHSTFGKGRLIVFSVL